MAKRWQVVFPSYKLMYFLNIKVACKWIVVMPADELYPDDFWNIREALVVQDPVNVFLALLAKLLISLEFLSLLVFLLKFLQF